MSDGAGVSRPPSRGFQLLSCGWQVALCDGRCSKARHVTGHHHHRLHHCLDLDRRTTQNAVSYFFLLSLGDLWVTFPSPPLKETPRNTPSSLFASRRWFAHHSRNDQKAPCPRDNVWSPPRRLSHRTFSALNDRQNSGQMPVPCSKYNRLFCLNFPPTHPGFRVTPSRCILCPQPLHATHGHTPDGRP